LQEKVYPNRLKYALKNHLAKPYAINIGAASIAGIGITIKYNRKFHEIPKNMGVKKTVTKYRNKRCLNEVLTEYCHNPTK
jgi:hypothetical protein